MARVYTLNMKTHYLPRNHSVTNSLFKVFITILPLLYYIANLQRMMTETNLFYFVSLGLVGVIGWVYFLSGAHENKMKLMVIVFSFHVSAFANMLMVGNVTPTLFVHEFLLFGVTFLLLQADISQRQASLFLYGTFFVFAVFLVRGVSASEVLMSSRNYISVLLILHSAIYYTVQEKKQNKPKILPAMISFLLAIWAVGRSGILTTGIMLLGMLRLRTYRKKPHSRMLFVFVTLLLITSFCFVVIVFDVPVSDIEPTGIGGFAGKGFDNAARIAIWGDYLRVTIRSSTNVIFGTNLDSVPLVRRFLGNTHNSFLQMHAYHGLISALFSSSS